jgi:endonuclease V-like protein UPF0215 family
VTAKIESNFGRVNSILKNKNLTILQKKYYIWCQGYDCEQAEKIIKKSVKSKNDR